MKKTGMFSFFRLACLVLAAAVSFFPNGWVEATGNQDGPPYYIVRATVDHKNICLGESTTLHIWYELTEGSEEKPPLISIQVNDGSKPVEVTGGRAPNGVDYVYTGRKRGVYQLWAVLNEGPRSQAGQDMALVHVWECKYSYKLTVKIDFATTTFNLVDEWVSTMESDGVFELSFKEPPPQNTYPLIGTLDVLEFTVHHVPESCRPTPKDWTYEEDPNGVVKVAAYGYRIGESRFVRVKFSNPQVGGTATVKMHCLGNQSESTYTLANYFTKEDPWIVEEFPITGGTHRVRIPFYRDVIKRFSALPGFKSSMKAELTVTPISAVSP